MTEDKIKRIHCLLNQTWEYIGYDTLSAVKECDGKDDIPRSEVVELCLDADRMEMLIADTDEDRAILKEFRELPYKKRHSIATKAFPYSRYGM